MKKEDSSAICTYSRLFGGFSIFQLVVLVLQAAALGPAVIVLTSIFYINPMKFSVDCTRCPGHKPPATQAPSFFLISPLSSQRFQLQVVQLTNARTQCLSLVLTQFSKSLMTQQQKPFCNLATIGTRSSMKIQSRVLPAKLLFLGTGCSIFFSETL